jgi:hypothetical protein
MYTLIHFRIHDHIAGDENFRCMQYYIIEWIHLIICKNIENISKYKTSYAHLHVDVFLPFGRVLTKAQMWYHSSAETCCLFEIWSFFGGVGGDYFLLGYEASHNLDWLYIFRLPPDAGIFWTVWSFKMKTSRCWKCQDWINQWRSVVYKKNEVLKWLCTKMPIEAVVGKRKHCLCSYFN